MLDQQYSISDRIRGKWLRLTMVSFAVAGAILVIWISMWNQDSNSSTGAIAPDFILPTIDGSFTLSDHEGEVVVLFYSSPGWKICQLEAPALGKIQKDLGNQDVVVVAINMDHGYGIQDWKEYWGLLGAADVIWAQDTNHTAASYGVTSSGTNIIINRSGYQVYKEIGPIMYPDLMAELEKTI